MKLLDERGEIHPRIRRETLDLTERKILSKFRFVAVRSNNDDQTVRGIVQTKSVADRNALRIVQTETLEKFAGKRWIGFVEIRVRLTLTQRQNFPTGPIGVGRTDEILTFDRRQRTIGGGQSILRLIDLTEDKDEDEGGKDQRH